MGIRYLREKPVVQEVTQKLTDDEPNFAPPSRPDTKNDNVWIPVLSVDDIAWIHMILRDTASDMERIGCLLTWTNPRRTYQCCISFVILALIIPLIPFNAKLIKLGKFSASFFWFILDVVAYLILFYAFILIPLQSTYPKYRRLFSPAEWLLRGLPDATSPDYYQNSIAA